MKRITTLTLLLILTSIVPSFASNEAPFQFYYSEGVRYFVSGNYVKAVDFFEAAVETDDAEPKGMVMLNMARRCHIHFDSAETLYLKNKFMDAIFHYDIVAQNNQRDMYVRAQMGLCLKKQGNVLDNMVEVAQGSFTMGRKDGPTNERPQRAVKMPRYYMDKYEVTNEEYARFINIKGFYSKEGYAYVNFDSPACMLDTLNGYCRVKPGYEKYPVVAVSWYGANDYAIANGKILPTEAQYEYAFADAQPTAADGELHPVGYGKPNKFGLYNMDGNVAEWCLEWYFDNMYSMTSNTNYNPTVIQISEYKSVRGGSFASQSPESVNRTYRDYQLPMGFRPNVGFRCVYIEY